MCETDHSQDALDVARFVTEPIPGAGRQIVVRRDSAAEPGDPHVFVSVFDRVDRDHPTTTAKTIGGVSRYDDFERVGTASTACLGNEIMIEVTTPLRDDEGKVQLAKSIAAAAFYLADEQI